MMLTFILGLFFLTYLTDVLIVFTFCSKIFEMLNRDCLNCYFEYAYLSRWAEFFCLFFNETFLLVLNF